MSFTFVCKFCNQRLEAEDSWAGMEVPCPTCKNNIVIPTKNAGKHKQHGKSCAQNIMEEFLYLTRFPKWPLHIDGCLKIDHPLLTGNDTLSKEDAKKLASLIYQIPIHTLDGRAWTFRDAVDNVNVDEKREEITLMITPDHPDVSELPNAVSFIISSIPIEGELVLDNSKAVISAIALDKLGREIKKSDGSPGIIVISSPFSTNSMVNRILCEEEKSVSFNEPLCVLSKENDLISNVNLEELLGVLIVCLRFPVESSVWNDGIKLLHNCYKLHKTEQISPFLYPGLLLRSDNVARQAQIVDYLDMCSRDSLASQYIGILAKAWLGKYMIDTLHNEEIGKRHIIQAGEDLNNLNKLQKLINQKMGYENNNESIPVEFTHDQWEEYNNLPALCREMAGMAHEEWQAGKEEGYSGPEPFVNEECSDMEYTDETWDIYSRVDFSKFRGTLSTDDRIQAVDILGRIILKEEYDKLGNDPTERTSKLRNEMKLKNGVFCLPEYVLFVASAIQILYSKKNIDIEPEVALNCVAYERALNWVMFSDDNVEIDYDVNIMEDVDKDLEKMQRNLEVVIKVIKRMKELFK